MLMQVRGVKSFVDMVRLAFASSNESAGDGNQAAAPAQAAAACGASAAAENTDGHVSAPPLHRRDEDDDDFDYDRKYRIRTPRKWVG